jgi:hypothetical protein
MGVTEQDQNGKMTLEILVPAQLFNLPDARYTIIQFGD